MPIINVHPIFVHFPIALLSIYCILELLSLVPILKKQSYWFYVKAVFVILGSLSTLPTILAGLLIKPQFESAIRIVSVHEKFAITTSIIFLFLGLLYVIAWTQPVLRKSRWAFLITIQKFFFDYHLNTLIAFVGLLIVMLTGALGGIIAFGPHTDPIAQFVYTIFFK